MVKEFHTNYDLLNPVVAQNVDYKTPESGAVIFKLCEIAKARNIDYTPSMESQHLLLDYCDRSGKSVPIDGLSEVPKYVPVPQAYNPGNPD
jgi:hypothetical protein